MKYNIKMGPKNLQNIGAERQQNFLKAKYLGDFKKTQSLLWYLLNTL